MSLTTKLLCVASLLLAGTTHAQKLPLTTNSDSALYYYYEGWRNVLDLGHFTNSEKAYRKMYQLDPDFLVGASLLARITTEPVERLNLLEFLENKKPNLVNEERLLLDVFIELIKLYSYRENKLEEKTIKQLEIAFDLAENNLRIITDKYPDDTYYLAEYIEVLHHNYGAQIALDSLAAKSTPKQTENAFLIGYRAQLQAETGAYEEALQNASKLEQTLIDEAAPSVYVVYANIYNLMGEKAKALESIDRALDTDPGNLSAQRLKDAL